MLELAAPLGQPLAGSQRCLSADLLIGVDPQLLELDDSRLQLIPQPGIGPRRVNQMFDLPLGLHFQRADLFVELVEFAVVGDVLVGDLDCLAVAALGFYVEVDWNQAGLFSGVLHLLEGVD
jgi:hypothetical protein